MTKLPVRLERKLAELFPKVKDRERFVSETLEQALEGVQVSELTSPTAIGGTLHLFTDGGSRGNPGQAAIGCVLIDPTNGEILEEMSKRIGIQTNNVAEYRALIAGLQLAKKYAPNHLLCFLDSELVVKQLNGEYKIRMASLEPLVEEIRELSRELSEVKFKHVPRNDNFRADALVNKALDAN